jgi:hypothetical protein
VGTLPPVVTGHPGRSDGVPRDTATVPQQIAEQAHALSLGWITLVTRNIGRQTEEVECSFLACLQGKE